MRIGAFDVSEPVSDLREPHAMAMLHPWINIGNVGKLVFSRLERLYGASEIARLTRPGSFFDFTRYRPIIYLLGGKRNIHIPNSYITVTMREKGHDFVFLHLLEPHMLSELYIDSVLLLLERLEVKRYCLLGSMYDQFPHTRPLIVTGQATSDSASEKLRNAGVHPSGYEGPTSIIHLVSNRASQMGIETMSMIVHLPQYSLVDDDYMGQLRILEVLSSLYEVPVEYQDIQKAEQQREQIDLAVNRQPEVKEIITQLENHYDARGQKSEEKEVPKLSPEVERFLKEMEKRFRAD
jgi:predicted ATP-grasp superfamily ATP-dependent carboligase